MSNSNGWIGVDLDGTLAEYSHWKGLCNIGDPISPMVERIREWLAAGQEVRIFTARMSAGMDEFGHSAEDFVAQLGVWLQLHGLPVLRATNVKDFHMIELWDDRAVQVIPNTGRRADGRA